MSELGGGAPLHSPGMPLEQAAMPGNTTPEMPTSHPDFDPGALTVEGLIRACPYYATLAETNLELAKTEAAGTVQLVQERETMREAGMSDAAVKKQQWSNMRARHKEKVRTEEKAVPKSTVQEHRAGLDHQPPVAEVSPATLTKINTDTKVAESPVVEAAKPLIEVISFDTKHAETASLAFTMSSSEQLVAAAIQTSSTVLERLTTSEFDITPDSSSVAQETESGSVITEVSHGGGKNEGSAAIKNAIMAEAEPAVAGDEVEALDSGSVTLEKRESGTEDKPSMVTFDRFAEAITTFVAEDSSLDEGVDWEAPYQPYQTKESPQAKVASEVATRLAELESQQKEVTMPIIQGIAKSLQDIKILQSKSASVEKIITAVENIKQQVVRLFEAIGIERNEEWDAKVEHFMQILLNPATQAKLLMLQMLEEGRGTHEVKRTFNGLYGLFTMTGDASVSHALGGTAVFLAHPAALQRLLEQLVPSKV